MTAYTDEEESNLIRTVFAYLDEIFDTVELGDRTIHPKASEFVFIGQIGNFKTVEQFFTPEWIRFQKDGTIEKELEKRGKFIDYKFTSAGYKYSDGGKPHSFLN